MPDKKEVLITYVGDVHALVTHGLQVLTQQTESLKDVSHKAAGPAVAEGKRVLQAQQSALAARLNNLGGSASSPIKDAVSAVAGVAAAVVNKMRHSETVKSLRDDATFFAGLGVAHMLLFTTATGFGDAETAAVAKRGYEETARMVMHLDNILPRIAVEELREHHPELADASKQTNSMVMRAWDRHRPSGV